MPPNEFSSLPKEGISRAELVILSKRVRVCLVGGVIIPNQDLVPGQRYSP